MTVTMIPIKITDEGLLLPRESYEDLGEIEALRQADRIVIRPKRDVDPEIRRRIIQALHQAGLLAPPLWVSLSEPVSLQERTELARKLRSDRQLSEIVIQEREAGW